MLDLPGIIEGAKDGKGRGRQVWMFGMKRGSKSGRVGRRDESIAIMCQCGQRAANRDACSLGQLLECLFSTSCR